MTTKFAIFILVLVLAIFLHTIPVSSYKSKCDKKRCRKQCFSEQDYCWCHNSDGQLVRSVKLANCDHSKSGSVRKNGQAGGRAFGSVAGCVRDKWTKFNENFLAMLRNERKHKSKIQLSSNKNETLTWKFQDLDVSRNRFLEKVEYEKWRSLVKKVLKPKSCARNLLRNADRNKDKLLSLNEWLDYFMFLDPREKPLPTTPKMSNDVKNVTAGGEQMVSSANANVDVGDSSVEDAAGEKSSRCEQERRKVLSVNRTDIYVPQCSASGLYEKQQCYHTASYCWCVDEVTGKIFAKTTVHNRMASCDAKTIAEAVTAEDSLNCSSNQFVRTMYMKIPNFSLKNDKINSQVQAVEIFRKIDKNRNEMIEKPEWKTFRLNTLRKLSKVEKLRMKPCCKKLLKRCDRNVDKKLNLIEWLQCFQLNTNTLKETRPETDLRSKPGRKPANDPGESNGMAKNGTKRFGPNPLKSFLKDDYDYVEEQ